MLTENRMRHDLGAPRGRSLDNWKLVETDVNNAITLAADTFARWRPIQSEDVARDHVLLMFGAKG